jgi:hypothetical protein
VTSAAWAQEALLPEDLGAGLLRVDLGDGVLAGFTTRHGGVSPAPWASLDLSASTGDEPARVRRNRDLLAGWVGAPVAFATQVHGDGVIELDPRDRRRHRHREAGRCRRPRLTSACRAAPTASTSLPSSH